jgi:hypothetical protein
MAGFVAIVIDDWLIRAPAALVLFILRGLVGFVPLKPKKQQLDRANQLGQACVIAFATACGPVVSGCVRNARHSVGVARRMR